MTDREFAAFFELAVATYAENNVLGGRWPAADAVALARAETERLLPLGLGTADNYFYAVRSEPSEELVGYVWFAEMQRGSTRIVFICQVFIELEHRRRGHARAALRAVQAMAETKGCSGMALHVFAHNKGAHELYRSLGYQVSSLNLIKPLPRSEA